MVTIALILKIYLGHGQVRMVTIALILKIYLGHGQVRMVTIALILTIYLGHGQVRMVTIALILTIYCKSINFRCIQFSRFLPTGQIRRYPFLHISYCTKAKEMYFSVNQFISRQRFILTRLNGITYYICHVKSAHSVLS
jgi:hypothetical protein